MTTERHLRTLLKLALAELEAVRDDLDNEMKVIRRPTDALLEVLGEAVALTEGGAAWPSSSSP